MIKVAATQAIIPDGGTQLLDVSVNKSFRNRTGGKLNRIANELS